MRRTETYSRPTALTATATFGTPSTPAHSEISEFVPVVSPTPQMLEYLPMPISYALAPPLSGAAALLPLGIAWGAWPFGKPTEMMLVCTVE